MPTPAERKALLFLAGVIVLGASVRVVRAARDDGPADATSRAALARQLSAVDSARESDARLASTKKGRTGRVTQSTPAPPIDMDVASAADIEALPRIGPVLARRIVQDRDEHGPFGSLDGFERVRGVGPALARTLRERVTFSGTARPSNAVVDQRLRGSEPPSKPPRRRREK